MKKIVKIIIKVIKFLFGSIFISTNDIKHYPNLPALDYKIAMVNYHLKEIEHDIPTIIKLKFKLLVQYRWKYMLWRFTKFTFLCSLIYLAVMYIVNPTIKYIYPDQKIVKPIILSYPSDTSRNRRTFLEQIGYVESRNRYTERRPNSQYWGYYQIGQTERMNVGYGDVSFEVFSNHPELQESCMLELMRYNKRFLKNYIKKYNGKVIGGILISESGIIAMAHTGVGNVMKFLDSNGKDVGEDGNGTKSTEYLKLGGYKLDL